MRRRRGRLALAAFVLSLASLPLFAGVPRPPVRVVKADSGQQPAAAVETFAGQGRDDETCRNSYDERCGPFRWDPLPEANRPMDVNVSFSPKNPRLGEEVTFNVTGRDPDLEIDKGCVTGAFGDGIVVPATCAYYACLQRFGVWSPPPKRPDAFDGSFRHAYATPGTYRVVFGIRSKPDCGNPYASSGSATTTVIVG